MVGVNDQERVQRLFHNRIRMIRTGLAAEHHVQEVAAVAAFCFRVYERFTDACLVREGCNRANLGNEACGSQVEHVGDVFIVVKARRKQTHGVHDGTQNAHRVSARRHLPKEVQQVFVEECVLGEQRAESCKLLLRRKFTVNQEPCGFGEGRLFGEILDAVAAVTQNSLFAVHISDGATGTTCVQVAVIQCYQAGFLTEFTDVETVFVFSTFDNGELDALSVVFQNGVVGHDSSS